MGRKSKLKQQRRLEMLRQAAEVLASEKANLLSRRRFIVLGLAAAIAGTGVLAYTYFGKENWPTYTQALKDKSKREEWVKGLVSRVEIPPYVAVAYADEKKYDELRAQHPGRICRQEDVFAVSIPRSQNAIAQGAETDIYVSPGCFLDLYKQVPEAWNDLEIIIKNTVINHEILHAGHFHHGIAEYPAMSFYNSNEEFNKVIFLAASEMLAHKSEFEGLIGQTSNASSQMFWTYLKSLQLLASPYYDVICNPEFSKDLNSNFVSRLRNDLNPKILFR